MGDKFERSRLIRDEPLLRLRSLPSPTTSLWEVPARIGHNNGPPLEDEPNDAFVRYRWRKAHQEAWRNPSMSILKFRVARAEAAGVTYREYMLELLDTGRHLQAGDVVMKPPSKP